MGFFRAKSRRGGRVRRIVLVLFFVLIGWFSVAHYSDFRRMYREYRIEKNLYRLRPGMNQAEVVLILGEPEKIRGGAKNQLYEYGIVRMLFRSDELAWISKPRRPYENLPIHKRLWYRTRDRFWPIDTRAS